MVQPVETKGNSNSLSLKENPEPIHSKFDNDPDMSELIGFFVDSLRQVSESIRSDFEKQDFAHLGRSAHQLKGAGGGYGFPTLTEAAMKVEVRVNAKMDAMGLKASVEELLDICQGVIKGSDSCRVSNNFDVRSDIDDFSVQNS